MTYSLTQTQSTTSLRTSDSDDSDIDGDGEELVMETDGISLDSDMFVILCTIIGILLICIVCCIIVGFRCVWTKLETMIQINEKKYHLYKNLHDNHSNVNIARLGSASHVHVDHDIDHEKNINTYTTHDQALEMVNNQKKNIHGQKYSQETNANIIVNHERAKDNKIETAHGNNINGEANDDAGEGVNVYASDSSHDHDHDAVTSK